MNIARRSLPATLLALSGLLIGLVSRNASAVPIFQRRPDQRVVPIAGTLTTPTEDIALKGQARINATTFSDPDLGGDPGVTLLIDFLNVIGVGLTTGTRYFAHGENRVVRTLRPSDVVELTFPISPVNASATGSTIPVLAIFRLTFNVDQGQLLTATASFSTPGF